MSRDFEQLWALKPKGKSKVYVYDKEKKSHYEKEIFRSYRTYLAVPPFNTDLPKSYMYDGIEESVPNILLPELRRVWEIDSRYNQMVVNWYEPDDFIEPHRDCDNYMIDDYRIGVISLNEQEFLPRYMQFEDLQGKKGKQVALGRRFVEIDRIHNRCFRHSVGPGKYRRISLTFRMLDMDKVNKDREIYARD